MKKLSIMNSRDTKFSKNPLLSVCDCFCSCVFQRYNVFPLWLFFFRIFTGEKENSEFRPYIHHLMLPTALFGLSCINSQLSSMWQHIKQTACKFTALPPNDLYLPSPELYCPQVPFNEPVCNVSAAQKAFKPVHSYDFLNASVSSYLDDLEQ